MAETALPGARTARGRTRLLNLLGIAHAERGDNAAAAEVFREEIAAARAAGMESFLVTSLGNLAEALLRIGDVQGAAANQLDCLELSRSSGGALHQVFSIIVAAHLAASHGDWTLATQLQSSADVHIEAVGWVFYAADEDRRRELLDEARRQLGAERFAASVDAGRALAIDGAADISADELRRIAARRKEPA